MRIAVGGIHIESCTFTTQTTQLADFVVKRGDEVAAAYPFGRWLGAGAGEVEIIGTVTANGGANGPVDPAVYDALEDEMAARLAAAGPVDGVYLDMHGAASVLGRQKAEERWLRRVRAVAGDAVISGSFDTHGNISRELAELVDLAAFHRHAPHIDNEQTRERAVRLLVDVITRGARPAKAWVRIPALLPGERTSTAREPGRSVFGRLTGVIEAHGLVDAAMCVGFYWADEERNHAAVLTTAWEPAAALSAASELAEAFWSAHRDFGIVADHSGSWAQALDYALTGPAAPLYISDAGDNVTAGASGELTYALAETLARKDVTGAGLRMLFAGLIDPAAVAAAEAAGPGAVLDRGLGTGGTGHSAPVAGPWRVIRLLADPASGGTTGALVTNGTVDVTVQRSRAPFVDPRDPGFPPGTLRGLAPASHAGYDVVVVKNGYLFPSQADAAGAFFMAITPGGTDLDPGRLAHTSIARPMYPWDEDFAVRLEPELIPARP